MGSLFPLVSGGSCFYYYLILSSLHLHHYQAQGAFFELSVAILWHETDDHRVWDPGIDWALCQDHEVNDGNQFAMLCRDSSFILSLFFLHRPSSKPRRCKPRRCAACQHPGIGHIELLGAFQDDDAGSKTASLLMTMDHNNNTRRAWDPGIAIVFPRCDVALGESRSIERGFNTSHSQANRICVFRSLFHYCHPSLSRPTVPNI